MGHEHTQENFQQAFFMPKLFDNNSIEQWEQTGSIEITQRAANHVKSVLTQYQQPELDEAKNEALLDYIKRREHELPGDVH